MANITPKGLLELIKKEGVYSPKTLSRSTGIPQSKIEDMILILQKNGYLSIAEKGACQSCKTKGFCGPKDKIRCIQNQVVELEVREEQRNRRTAEQKKTN